MLLTCDALNAIPWAMPTTVRGVSNLAPFPGKFKSLEDQVIRSASSVAANLAEGNSRTGRDRQHYFRIAYGSAKEVDVHLRILVGAGIIAESKATETLELFDRVRAMTWRLLHASR